MPCTPVRVCPAVPGGSAILCAKARERYEVASASARWGSANSMAASERRLQFESCGSDVPRVFEQHDVRAWLRKWDLQR
eukprot:scaffold1782_cov414-Prasinococcus_capsulatus_cf.AAC.7